MVRTLVFRTNNAGSIPAGLIMLYPPAIRRYTPSLALRKKTRLNLVLKTSSPSRFRYRFKFVTLVSPRSGYRPPFHQLGSTVSSPNRVCLKYSYLVASWLHLMSTKSNRPQEKELWVDLTVLPASTSKITLTKAPMAHKTNSKEQFLTKHYNVSLSVTSLVEPEYAADGLVDGAFLMSQTKKLFPAFGTNLLFTKSATVTSSISATGYMKSLV